MGEPESRRVGESESGRVGDLFRGLAASPTRPRAFLARRVALQLYRATVIFSIALLVRNQHIRLQIDGGLPIVLSEVQPFLPGAAALRADLSSGRTGLDVFDAQGRRMGYALHTLPECREIKGYAGPTDTLLVFDDKWLVRGVAIRRSADTITHVHDVAHDPYFLKSWAGKSWSELGAMDLKRAGVEGVSGASLTSMGLARSIVFRVQKADDAQAQPPPMARRWADAGVIGMLLCGLLIAFTPLRGSVWLRAVWQMLLIGGLGLLSGQLLALSLAGGWTASGVAWRVAPALALLAAASLLLPWATKKALYCQYLCPHGAAQEWLHRLAPRAWRVELPAGLDAGLRWTPGLLLLLGLSVLMLGLPFDLAELEPFDAYLLRAGAWVSIVIALLGLLLSIFVPMAYCKYGCPTGALLEFVRARGPGDGFGRRDAMGLMLLAATLWMYVDYERIGAWIAGM